MNTSRAKVPCVDVQVSSSARSATAAAAWSSTAKSAKSLSRRAEQRVAARRGRGAQPGAQGEGGDACRLAEGRPALVLEIAVGVTEEDLDHLLLPLLAVVRGQQPQDGAVARFEKGRRAGHARPPAIRARGPAG